MKLTRASHRVLALAAAALLTASCSSSGASSSGASSSGASSSGASSTAGGPTLLITSSDGFKVIVSLVSAAKSATADPNNPSPPGHTRLVLRLNEHNVQTDRPAPFLDLSRTLVLLVNAKSLPGITMNKGPFNNFRLSPDCEAWGATNAPRDSSMSGWMGVPDTSNGNNERDPALCQLGLSTVIDNFELPSTIPAGGDLTQDLRSDTLPESLPLTVFKLAEATGKSPYTPVIPLK